MTSRVSARGLPMPEKSPAGPTQDGQPVSHPQFSMSRPDISNNSSCSSYSLSLKPTPPG